MARDQIDVTNNPGCRGTALAPLRISFGEVDPSVYAAYLAAVKTGKRADFDALTMGGTERLVDPQAGIAFELETVDQSQNSIPSFDTLTSPGLAAQMIEAY